jgi:hypothetical protein
MKVRIKKFAGLYTLPNPLSQVPEGALSVADDAVIDADGIIENRRGFNFYGSALASRASSMLKFKNASVINCGTTLQYDSDGNGTYVPYAGSYSPVANTRIRSVEFNGSLFFTTSNGIYKLDSLTSTPRTAGIPQPLDLIASFASAPVGFMNYNSQVAYRMTWARKDANNITTESAPSQRTVIVNNLVNISTIVKSGSTATVTTSGPHILAANDIVTISNAESFISVSGITQSAGIATVTTGVAHGLIVGDTVVIRGANPDAYNGTYVIQTVPSSTTYTYFVTGTPASPATGTISTGRDVSAYNGSYLVLTAPTSTTFTYQIVGNPLTNASAISGLIMQVGKARDTSLTFQVPFGIIAGDLFNIYRSETTVSQSVSPSDEMQLVYTGAYTAGTSVTVTDVTPDSFKGAALYTNSTQEGIAQANNTPPLAKDIAFYKNVTFYSNTSTAQTLSLQLLSPDGITRNTDYLVFGGTQYFFSSVESLSGTLKFRLFADIAGAALSRSSTTATITAANHGLSIGDTVYLSGATDARYNSGFIVQTVPSSSTFTVTVSALANSSDTVIVSTGTPAQNIAATVLSLVKVINRTHPTLYAFYTSGPDDIPGSFQVKARNLSSASFATVTTAAISNNFSPVVPTAGTSLSSTNEVLPNRLFYSKDRQPDSVPTLNYYDIGPRDEAILRIVGLRDSLFIIKEQSIYILSGDDSRSFTVTLFDNNAACIAPDSVASLNNTIYMYSTQGVVSVGDGGVAVVSRPIENLLLPLSDYVNASTIMHGVGYESERKYILFFQNASTDTVATAAYVYNTFTRAWTKWLKPASCGLVISNHLYIGNTYTNSILKERKLRDKTDKQDEAAPATIAVDSTGRILTVSGYTYGNFGLSQGQLVYQSGKYAKILTVDPTGLIVTVDRKAGFTNGACMISNPIKHEWRLLPQVGGADINHPGSPDEMKHFREVQVYPSSDSFSQANLVFASDLSTIDKLVPFAYLSREQGFGYTAWGMTPWGDSGQLTGATPLRTLVPIGLQRCRSLIVGFKHNTALENVSMLNVGYVYEDNSERTTR